MVQDLKNVLKDTKASLSKVKGEVGLSLTWCSGKADNLLWKICLIPTANRCIYQQNQLIMLSLEENHHNNVCL